MNLSRKIILLVVSTFIALVFIIAATSDIILLKSFARLERKVLKDNLSKVSNELDESIPELDASAKDLAEQIKASDVSLVNRLGVATFANHRIDFIVCLDYFGNVMAYRGADFHVQRLEGLSAQRLEAIRKIALDVWRGTRETTLGGFAELDGVVAQCVFRVVGKDKVLFIGRYVDQQEVQRIASLTNFAVEVRPYSDKSLPGDFKKARDILADKAESFASNATADRISGFSVFNDLFGKPVLILKVTEQRLIYQQGKDSIFYILAVIFLSGGVFCIVVVLFMRGAVLRRLSDFSAKAGEISRCRDMSARLEVKGEDELEDLAVALNSMLDSLESAEQALKESEERYRALFERAPDAIIIIAAEGDDAGRIVAANRAAAVQHGYSVDELCTLKVFDLNTPETNEMAPDIFRRTAEGEWVTCEMWHFRKDGSRFPIEVHAGPLKIDGKLYVLGFDRDITVRKLSEESDRMYLEQISLLNSELAAKAAELSAANQELESFNYSVSHDMRGPLTRISGYSQILLEERKGLTEDAAKTYLTRIYESCCWLDELLATMLNLSRVVRAEFHPVEVDMSSMVNEVVQERIMAEPERQIDVVITEGVTALADPNLLRILLDNLVGNAWKYSADSIPGRIEFGVESEGAVPVYYIRDNGIGFDMKDADKLFRVFSRLHDASRFKGSGIGLATVQRVVARHGGRIWATGQTGQGATFCFTLQPDNVASDSGRTHRLT